MAAEGCLGHLWLIRQREESFMPLTLKAEVPFMFASTPPNTYNEILSLSSCQIPKGS